MIEREFDTDEMNVLAMMEGDTRNDTVENIKRILPKIKGDAAMYEVVKDILDKLEKMNDDEFANLELDLYRWEEDV